MNCNCQNKEPLLQTNLPLPAFIKGKVRDTYDLGDYLLIVVTDRISAFDVVLPCGIEDKGEVLNRISAFWFDKTKDIVQNHMVELLEKPEDLAKYLPQNKKITEYPCWLAGRSMIVKKVQRITVECIARGYISGSAWKEYKKDGTACGIKLPDGLIESQQLPQVLFTPTTKGDNGEHDVNMSYEDVVKTVGDQRAQELKDTTVKLYQAASNYARTKGFIIADTKFEFGIDKDSRLVLIDEALTPDSSRFWDMSNYQAGRSQDSYDKQPVRDYLETLHWDKSYPGPCLPQEVQEKATQRYRTAYERLTK
ncbi:MAG: phosphoribosylaminoimidazolesuccinocarboxamide synthase [Chloroflexi bacterium]|nr:phosphoribosylaminoimidazolesuccinocarboxamide synthase [Chloroflexota bacterium]